MATAQVFVDGTGWRSFSGGDLPNSGVTAATYGDSTHVGAFTVAANGTITAASSVAISGGGGGGGGVLAVAQYAPATAAIYNVTTAALAALDTTNLTVSFTVPASGKAIVQYASAMVAPAGSGSVLGLGLLNHSGGAQVGNTLSNVLAVGVVATLTLTWYLTGLSAGTLGLDIAAGVSTGTGQVFAQGFTGNVSSAKVGPATITVFTV